MANDKKEIRYAAMLCCVSDMFVLGNMDRTERKMSLNDCVNAIKLLAKTLDTLPYKDLADNAWNMVTTGKENIKIIDIQAVADNWSNHVAFYHYQKQKYNFLATRKLRQWVIASNENLDDISRELGIDEIKLSLILDYKQTIPSPLRHAVFELYDSDGVLWSDLGKRNRAYLCKNKKEC